VICGVAILQRVEARACNRALSTSLVRPYTLGH
jgi:hypothetical protein